MEDNIRINRSDLFSTSLPFGQKGFYMTKRHQPPVCLKKKCRRKFFASEERDLWKLSNVLALLFGSVWDLIWDSSPCCGNSFVGISLVQYFYVVFSQQINANQLKSTMESSSIPWTPTSVGPYFCQRRVNVTGAMALKSGQHKQLHVTWTNYIDLSRRLGIPQMVVIVRECPSKIPKTFRYNLPRCDFAACLTGLSGGLFFGDIYF